MAGVDIPEDAVAVVFFSDGRSALCLPGEGKVDQSAKHVNHAAAWSLAMKNPEICRQVVENYNSMVDGIED